MLDKQIDINAGQVLRRLRKQEKMTQKQLAQKSGISYQQLQKYENGTSKMSAGRLYDFATFFGTKVECFFPAQDQFREKYAKNLLNSETVKLVSIFREIKPPKRKYLISIVEMFGEQEKANPSRSASYATT